MEILSKKDKMLAKRVNPYHRIPSFHDLEKEDLKTWEKETVLVTSIFSFSHNILYPSQKDFLF